MGLDIFENLGLDIFGSRFLISDLAGISINGNSAATDQSVQHGYELITVFDTNMVEEISNGDHTNNNITVGATANYLVWYEMSAVAGGTNKTYELFVFVIATSSSAIASCTAANPVVVTATAHGFTTGNIIKITGVATADELNDRLFRITKLTNDTFSLQEDNSGNIDGTAFGAGTGGIAEIATILTNVHSQRKFAAADVGSLSGQGYNALTIDTTLELYIKNITSATNIVVEACSFGIERK